MTINPYQHFEKPINEVVKNRYSVRTYEPENLSDEMKNSLKTYAEAIKGPFSPRVRLEIINDLENTDGKLGTYGVIKGAKDYIAAIVEDGEKDLEQLGYILEQFILYATSKNIGTCWLGGTFKKSDFSKLLTVEENEKFLIVTPIGHPRDKKSMLESFMRFAAGSNHRKEWMELFYEEDFNNPLQENNSQYSEALEAVRLAPSASNKQPWRVLKKDDGYHFYLKADKGYGDKLGFNIQRVDIGIAMCHFEMVLQEFGKKGSWIIQNPGVDTSALNDLSYTVSWKETVE